MFNEKCEHFSLNIRINDMEKLCIALYVKGMQKLYILSKKRLVGKPFLQYLLTTYFSLI